MAFQSLILTDAANAFTAQAWASSGVITETRVAFGSGFPGVSDYVPGYTNLKTFVMNGTVTGINNLVAGQLTVRSNISSANAPTTFNINEIGIFGKFAGGPETLLAYMTTGANTGDTMTPTGGGTPVIKDYALLMKFQQAISSSGVIQLNQVVGLHAGSHISTGVDPIPVAVSTATGLVPVPGGTGLNGLVDTSPVTWVPILLAITTNTTLYVSTSGNDSTALPNNPSFPWLTWQAAVNYLNPYFITPSAIVTISVGPGVFNIGSQISVNHPNGSQIQIVGSIANSHNITALAGTGGTSGARTVTLTISGTVDISPGDYVTISGIFTSPQNQLNGIFPVASVSGQNVTITIAITASLPSFGTVNTGTMQSIKTVVNATGNNNGLVVGSFGLNLVKNIVFVGNGSSGIGVLSSFTINLTSVGVYSWTQGAIAVNAGSCVLTNVFACFNFFVIAASQCSMSATNVVASYNTKYGFQLTGAAFLTINSAWSLNNTSGILVGGNASVTATGLTCENNTNGISAGSGGTFQVTLSGSVTVLLNTTDLVVLPFGQILKASGTSLFYSTTSQAINTVTASGVIAP
jgi:hypothetical protein